MRMRVRLVEGLGMLGCNSDIALYALQEKGQLTPVPQPGVNCPFSCNAYKAMSLLQCGRETPGGLHSQRELSVQDYPQRWLKWLQKNSRSLGKARPIEVEGV